MSTLLDSLLGTVTHPRFVIAVVWTGMAGLTVALVVLMRTRWGQENPLRKCAVLSLFAHLLFLAYATTVHIVRAHPGYGHGNGTVIRVSMVDGHDTVDARGKADGVDGGKETGPWDVGATEINEIDPRQADLPPADEPTPAPPEVPPAPVEPVQSEPPASDEKAAVPEPMLAAPLLPVEPDPKPASAATPPAAAETPVAASTSPPVIEPVSTPELAAVAGPLATLVAVRPPENVATGEGTGQTIAGHSQAGKALYAVPEMYRERTAPNRLRIAEGYGGSGATEAAVAAALEWLAKHQAADGRWDASDHGAGRETRTLGQDRKNAGQHADTGLTGLALLAFLGSGNTHQSGSHPKAVERGVNFLISQQASDGNLAGQAEIYEFMYCHGMATLALAETYAMTGDRRIEQPLRRAINFTINAQQPSTGGWRYKPPYSRGERGDTSQLGWQLMSLKSAELSGIPMPERTRQGIVRYLNSVTSGTRGGLASYRPEERVTHPMTAEALACREFLGLSLSAGAADEAGDFLLSALPGAGPANFYYWYYGTVAMFQLQGQRWQTWNSAISTVLTRSQRTDADATGSWDPDPLWGGHGGRVFSTSLGALCLEVYYRYLPLYTASVVREKTAK